MDKFLLRTQARARRTGLKAALPDFASRIAAFAREVSGGIVAGYWPIRDEADPRALMRALAAGGAVVALPRIEGQALSFRRWNDDDALVGNHHAIPEPRDDAEIITPDVVLVPLLAFDAAGHRLGYGGGYYDRTLPLLKARTVGIAYDGQRVDALPREAHDHPLDAVLTEAGLHHTPGSRR